MVTRTCTKHYIYIWSYIFDNYIILRRIWVRGNVYVPGTSYQVPGMIWRSPTLHTWHLVDGQHQTLYHLSFKGKQKHLRLIGGRQLLRKSSKIQIWYWLRTVALFSHWTVISIYPTTANSSTTRTSIHRMLLLYSYIPGYLVFIRWLGRLSSCLLKSISRAHFSPSAHTRGDFFLAID